MRCGRARTDAGYTLVATLILLALTSLGLSVVGPIWSQSAQREREQELLRIGSLYAQAIASYRDASPGRPKQFPDKLDALLLDVRFVGVMRHLRKGYPDPVNPGMPWGTVLDGEGRVTGVYSLSDQAPIAQGALVIGDLALPAAKRYSEWKFIAKPKS